MLAQNAFGFPGRADARTNGEFLSVYRVWITSYGFMRHARVFRQKRVMAMHGNIIPGPEADVEDVHELFEIVDSGGSDLIEAGDIIQSCREPLRALDREECLAAREGLVR